MFLSRRAYASSFVIFFVNSVRLRSSLISARGLHSLTLILISLTGSHYHHNQYCLQSKKHLLVEMSQAIESTHLKCPRSGKCTYFVALA